MPFGPVLLVGAEHENFALLVCGTSQVTGTVWASGKHLPASRLPVFKNIFGASGFPGFFKQGDFGVVLRFSGGAAVRFEIGVLSKKCSGAKEI